ncbi:MAG: DUF4388 domain-containing protein [Candidatus Rokuibacteriota bacterium]
MKVLLVDPDGSRVSTLREALTAAGAEVSVAPGGTFALTMLERNRQDAIVSRARIDDMEGHELCAILRSDPEARDVRFVLVAGQDDVDPAQTAAAGIDLVVPPSLDASVVLSIIVQLVRRDHELPRQKAVREAGETVLVDGAAAPPPAQVNGAPLPSRTFQGSLGVMGMEELTQAIAVGGKTGRLILALGSAGGLVAFESGRVVHAEFGETLGEEAFGALLAVSMQERSGKFCFIPSDASALAAMPKTIAKSVEQLLLSAAVELDARAPAAAHTPLEER